MFCADRVNFVDAILSKSKLPLKGLLHEELDVLEVYVPFASPVDSLKTCVWLKCDDFAQFLTHSFKFLFTVTNEEEKLSQIAFGFN